VAGALLMDAKDDEAVAAKLSEAAAASIDWAASNGVAFDHGKTEAAIFRRKKTPHCGGEGRR